MIHESDVLRGVVRDEIGMLLFELNSHPTWTIKKFELSEKLHKLLRRKKYEIISGKRAQYQMYGGIGASYLYHVPEGKQGQLKKFRGQLVRLICVGHDRYVSVYMVGVMKGTPNIISQIHLK
jgi:hypothetical protein